MRVKIFQLAKDLGLPSKEVMALIEELKLGNPDSHFESIPEEAANVIRRHVIRGALEVPAGESPEESTSNEPPPQPEKPTIIVRRKRDASEVRTTKKDENADPVELPDTLLGSDVSKDD